VGEIPEDMREQAEEYREALVEAAVSLDDEAMEAYLEGTVRPVCLGIELGLGSAARARCRLS